SLNQVEARLLNWRQRYFPEFDSVFKQWDGVTALSTLRRFPLPLDIVRMTPETIVEEWKQYSKRPEGLKRAKKLHKSAERSIGITVGLAFARQELKALLEQYDLYSRQIEIWNRNCPNKSTISLAPNK
ncbi:hypothetical protein ACE1TI_21340, partial [Alteribacillus sp. JSM 102045]